MDQPLGKSEYRNPKSEMVRLAVRQAHGHEQRRMAHHPERSRRTISKFECSKFKTKPDQHCRHMALQVWWLLKGAFAEGPWVC